jgi:hypothetical protein
MAQRKPKPAASVPEITALVVRELRAAGWAPPAGKPAPVERAAPMQTIVLRVPAEIIEALDERGSNRSDVARAILARGLGLDVPEPADPKGPRLRPRRQR